MHFKKMLDYYGSTWSPRSSIPTSDSRRKRYRSIEIPAHSCRFPHISRRNRPESNRILTQFSHRKCHRTGNVDFPSVSVKRNSIGTRPNPAGNHRKRRGISHDPAGNDKEQSRICAGTHRNSSYPTINRTIRYTTTKVTPTSHGWARIHPTRRGSVAVPVGVNVNESVIASANILHTHTLHSRRHIRRRPTPTPIPPPTCSMLIRRNECFSQSFSLI